MSKLSKMLLIAALIIAAAVFYGPALVGRLVQGPAPEEAQTELRFSEITTDFMHRSDLKRSLPFMGIAAIDADNDGVDEIFAGGGAEQDDALMKFDGQHLTRWTGYPGLHKKSGDATFGAASIDATRDGLADLFVARESGVYFYENRGDRFEGRKIEFDLDAKSLTLSIALGDINNDGAVDLYLSNYIRMEFVEGETIFNKAYGGISNLLLNNGDNTFIDITRKAGIYHQHNTFLSMFVDLDNSGHSDLVVAHDTGTVGIYRNNGDLTFTEMPNPTTYSYPMGIAVGDYNNDGRMDLYFSNVGTTLPDALVRGDLREDQTLNKNYMLLENRGDFQFADVAVDHNAALYGFGWGVVMYDFNNDTRQDYLITQNYARFPGVEYLELYPGRLLQQFEDGQFKSVEKDAGIVNQNFGIAPVITDFNQDGWPDVVLANINGPLRAFLNAGGKNNWLKVRLPDNPHSIGAIVQLKTQEGQIFTRQFYTSEGLCSDQTHELFFGLGAIDAVKSVSVRYQDGRTQNVEGPQVKTIVSFDKGI